MTKKSESANTKHKVEVRKQKSIASALTKEAQQFKKEFAERLLKLVTSGFGLVSALAWNELIKEAVKTYVEPFFGKDSGFISLLIYALAVTFLAVFVTYQLSKIVKEEKK
jgi:hypothetical protein